MRIWRSEVGWKIEGSWRSVIKRVFDGAEGDVRGGMSERSRERGRSVRLGSGNVGGDEGGETLWSNMFAL